MSSNVEIITFKGKKIIYGNYSDAKGDEFIKRIDQHETESYKSRDKKILHLLNFTNSKMNSNAKKRADKMINNLSSKGYEIKTACFGITGLQKIIAGAVMRDMYFAKNADDAKEWLINQ